jgi:hypothetical protein
MHFLPTIDAANKLKYIRLDVVLYDDACVPKEGEVWGDLDTVLARTPGRFQRLRTLAIKFCVRVEELDPEDGEVWSDEIGESVVAAHPLLLARGVLVDVWCVDI